MKSCIFVNKHAAKFKGAREELHVIRTNCARQGSSSMRVNTPYGDGGVSIVHEMVIKTLSTFLLG